MCHYFTSNRSTRSAGPCEAVCPRARTSIGCGAPLGRSDMSVPPALFRAKGAATRGWYPACRWRSPGPPAEYSHPAANVPRCRSAGGCRRGEGLRGVIREYNAELRSGGECRREGSGTAGVAGRGGIAGCGRSPGRPGTAAITGGSPGGAGGITGVPSWTPSAWRHIGTVGRRLWNRAGGQIRRRAGVKTRWRRDRTSAGTDGTRVQSGIGRNGQRAAGVGGLCRGRWRRRRRRSLGHLRFAGRDSRRRHADLRSGLRHKRLLGERRLGHSRWAGYGGGPYRETECYPQYGGRNVAIYVPPNFKPLTCLDNPVVSGSLGDRSMDDIPTDQGRQPAIDYT